MADKYAIRRALRYALARFFCPQDLNTILCDDRVIILDADNSRIKTEWDELTCAGYLVPVQGYPEYRALKPSLRAKLENGETLLDDPLLAGPSALRG